MHKRQTVFLLFSAHLISGFASGITFFAIPWLIVSQWGDTNGKFLNSMMMGIITFLCLFWGTYAGTLIDKFNRKRIFQISHTVIGLILCGIAGYGFYQGGVPFPLMAISMGLTLFSYTIYYPNLYAFIQEVFPPEDYKSLNSAIEIQGQFTNFLGMLIAGLLIAGSSKIPWWPSNLGFESWPLESLILMDGITYLISMMLISIIPYSMKKDRKIDSGPIKERIVQGFRYLFENRPLFIFGLCSYILFATILVVIQVVYPIYIYDVLNLQKEEGALVFSYVEMMYSLGAIFIGGITLLFPSIMGRYNLVGQAIGLLLLSSMIYISWGLFPSVNLFLVGSFLMGLANPGTRILRVTYIVRIVPNNIIGRVSSVFSILNILFRTVFVFILIHPFFSGPENGEHILYALIMFGSITAISALILLFFFRIFDKKASYGI